MKTLIVTLVAVASLVLAGMAFAGQGGGPSCNGAVHGAFANANGNFGFLGEAGGTPGYHDGAVGQEQGATGYNNSTAAATCNAAG
jgi:hypothetical protein